MVEYKQTCAKKNITLFLTLVFTLGCSLPLQITWTTPPSATPTLTQTLPSSPTPQNTPMPGSDQNPLILALAPSAHPNESAMAAADELAAYLETQTGYQVVTVIPASETALLEALINGNAHIVSLSPYAYVTASQNRSATAILARLHNGEMFYGAQIIISRDGEFTTYFNEERNENTTTPALALQQFRDKKPCWSDKVSPSGYVVPLGLLNQVQVEVRSGAFLEGQPNVVRGVYADDICDFGATFVDARTSPSLEADYPDVTDKVRVAWRIPAIIPYENISVAPALSFEMRQNLQRAFIQFLLIPEGKTAMQTIYGFDQVLPVDDAAYAEFISLVTASKLDLADLIE